MSEIRTYYIKAFASAGGYTGDDLASYLENEPLYTDDIGTAVDVTAEIAALRAENERLREALREIDAKTGHFGEAPPPPEWTPMLSLIAWVGKTARAALAEIGGKR